MKAEQGGTARLAHPNKISAQHEFVYRKSGNFAAWPANGGIWHWGDEILVQFQVGTYADTHLVTALRSLTSVRYT